jgi:integrase
VQKKNRAFGTVRQVKTGYQARYTHEGKQQTLGTFPTETDADNALVLLQADILRGKYQDANRGSITFAEFADKAMVHRATKLKPGTISNDRSNLTMRLLPAFGSKKLRDIRKKHVSEWWDAMAGQPIVRRNSYTTLSGILSYAVDIEELELSPCQIRNAYADVAARPQTFSIDQFVQVVNAAPEAFRPVLWVMFASHARLGELCGLRRSDVNMETGEVLIARQSKGTRITTTKSGKTRSLVMLQQGTDALLPYFRDHPRLPSAPLFNAPRGGRMNPSHFYKVWDAATEKAGVPEMVPHSIRHISLSFCAQAGMTVEELQHRAGHSDPKMTMKYVHSTDERKAEAAATASAALQARLGLTA